MENIADKLLYGAAYYPEYMPVERMEEDMRLLRDAGFNLIRVAESTWSTWEPREGEFDLSLLRRTLETAGRYGLRVIVGTPTYAIPPWLARKYPDIMSETHTGPLRYGCRQSFDLTHPAYRRHCEIIIRKVCEAAAQYDCVIGYQLDNETKPYDTCSARAQALFKKYLRRKFRTVDRLNREFGFAYWSNALGSWDDLPDVRGTINASYGAEYQAFQRSLVTDFLLWQRSLVEEYLHPGQFITHNFDYQWRGWSFGPQPDVDQDAAGQAVTVAGCDIYHPGGGKLTGAEIAFGGAVARGIKKQNYLVLETQAQGNFGYLPYPGQLKLQALSHVACGAQGVEYWHWHSIHNALESYWKGVLSHDLQPNDTYRECADIGRTLARLSPKLLGMRKENRVAVMISTRSQAALEWFPTCQAGFRPDKTYADYVRWLCDSLYRLNVEYDILWDSQTDFSGYSLLILPTLYAAPEKLLRAVGKFVREGGNVIATFRTGFANEHLKIYSDAQPHLLTRVFGLTYDRFTVPEDAALASDYVPLPEGAHATDWMELVTPVTARPLVTLRHPAWDGTPAVTLNRYGRGKAVYLSACFGPEALDALLRRLLPELNIRLPGIEYPLVLRRAVSPTGATLVFFLNYSPRSVKGPDGTLIPPWGVRITENGKEI